MVDVSSLEVGYAPATALASEVDSTVFRRLEYDVPRYAEVVTLGLHEVFLRCGTSTLGRTQSDLVGFLLMNKPLTDVFVLEYRRTPRAPWMHWALYDPFGPLKHNFKRLAEMADGGIIQPEVFGTREGQYRVVRFPRPKLPKPHVIRYTAIASPHTHGQAGKNPCFCDNPPRKR